MKEFEDALRNLPKPNIRVETFRQDLRRDLKRAMSTPDQSRYRVAFAFAGGLAIAFAFFLVLFILRPEMPTQINSWLEGGSENMQAENSGSAVPIHSTDSNYLNQLLNGEATAARDEAYIESWYAQQALAAQVKQIEDEKIYAVRKFRMNTGQQVVVFTELGNEGGSFKTISQGEQIKAY